MVRLFTVGVDMLEAGEMVLGAHTLRAVTMRPHDDGWLIGARVNATESTDAPWFPWTADVQGEIRDGAIHLVKHCLAADCSSGTHAYRAHAIKEPRAMFADTLVEGLLAPAVERAQIEIANLELDDPNRGRYHGLLKRPMRVLPATPHIDVDQLAIFAARVLVAQRRGNRNEVLKDFYDVSVRTITRRAEAAVDAGLIKGGGPGNKQTYEPDARLTGWMPFIAMTDDASLWVEVAPFLNIQGSSTSTPTPPVGPDDLSQALKSMHDLTGELLAVVEERLDGEALAKVRGRLVTCRTEFSGAVTDLHFDAIPMPKPSG